MASEILLLLVGKVLFMLNIPRGHIYPYQLENIIRESILQRGFAKGLVVLEGLYYLKYRADKWLTFDQIYRLLSDNFGCSFRLVYEGLQSRLIFNRRKDKAKAHQKGARPYLYRIPSPAELRAEFAPNAEPTPSDSLTKEDLKGVSSYRIALHRELCYRKWLAGNGKGFKIHRQLQAKRLNVSKRTIRTYDKNLGFSHEANYTEKRIYWQDWNKLPRYKHSFDGAGKPLPSRKWLKVVDWTTGHETNLPYVAYLAYINLKEGLAVYEMERDANTYFPYKRPNKAEFEGDPVDFYLAECQAIEDVGFYRDSEGRWYHPRE